MRKPLFLLSLLTFCFSLSKAQSLDDIIGKYTNAMGGKDKVLSVKNLYMEGGLDLGGNIINVKYWIINKKAIRYDYTINGMTSYNIITTDSGWIFNPMMGQKTPELLTPSIVRTMQPQLDPEGLLINYKTNGYKVELKGKDEVDGTTTFKIVQKISDSLSNTYYIDTATYYIVRVTTKASADGKQIDLSRDFSNYQKTSEGYIFPMNMSLGLDMGSQVKFTIVKVNTDLNIALFKPQR